MLYETLPIHGASLTVYAPDNSPEIDPDRRRPAVLVCPGGAYCFCSDREAEPVALQLLARGCCVFVLRYAVAPARYPTALVQLAEAVRQVRTRADRFHADPDRVFVMGFSAGGHLAASLGVRWQEPWLARQLDCRSEDLRPNGMVLCYPVLTGGPFTHRETMENLLGTKDEALWDAQSLEKLVSAHTPPTFLWHTFEDPAVPAENSLQFAAALRRAGVSTELHLYPHGTHGLSLATLQSCSSHAPELVQPEVSGWIDLAARWINAL